MLVIVQGLLEPLEITQGYGLATAPVPVPPPTTTLTGGGSGGLGGAFMSGRRLRRQGLDWPAAPDVDAGIMAVLTALLLEEDLGH